MKNPNTKIFFAFIAFFLLFNLISGFKYGIFQPIKRQDPQEIKYDTIIKTKAYTSYFSKSLRVPVIVAYKLYHGGGECFGASMTFKNDIKSLKTATKEDYMMDVFYKAHMADAQDFSYDCKLEELTYRYYNCIPQTAKLNRGFWNYYNKEIRKLSQTDSLLVICYNSFDGKTMEGTDVAVPSVCYKFVYSLTDWSLAVNMAFTNDVAPKKLPVDLKLADNVKKIVTKK